MMANVNFVRKMLQEMNLKSSCFIEYTASYMRFFIDIKGKFFSVSVIPLRKHKTIKDFMAQHGRFHCLPFILTIMHI